MSDRVVWGFTASRELPELAKAKMVDRLVDLSRNLDVAADEGSEVEFVTGAARGGDAFIGEWLVSRWGILAYHTIVVPANRKQVDYWWERQPQHQRKWFNVIEMPPGTDYRDRNQAMVDRATAFDGFPLRPEVSSVRSGTWMTINMAKRAGKLRGVTVTYEYGEVRA